MTGQRYERIAGIAEEDEEQLSPRTSTNPDRPIPIPASPPPSFHSRDSSPSSASSSLRRRNHAHEPLISDAERALAESFDADSDDEEDNGGSGGNGDNGDDRRRVGRGAAWLPRRDNASAGDSGEPQSDSRQAVRTMERRVTELPVFTGSTTSTGRGPIPLTRSPNDGVFANLSAKPESGEKIEDQPPSYEQAAADATPPYWETTILAPGFGSDEVFIDGLPVGSLFSFAWNALISMSFQLVGFLLTYLLHTTHAAKNGSKAGLGIALVQWGFSMKTSRSERAGPGDGGAQQPQYTQPADASNLDAAAVAASGDGAAAAAAAAAAMAAAANDSLPIGGSGGGGGGGGADGASAATWSITNNDLLAYALMVAGWFLLIRSVSNYIKARRHEQLVLQSPDRGLGIPVVAEGERAETVV